MSSSGIIISYEAAERDVRNLEQAKATLNDALETLYNLLATAESIHGKTGTAIQNKTKQLIGRLKNLNMNLESAQKAINTAVKEKREADESAAQLINNNNGGF